LKFSNIIIKNITKGSITIKNETKQTIHHGNMKRYFFMNPTLHKTGFQKITLFVHYTVGFFSFSCEMIINLRAIKKLVVFSNISLPYSLPAVLEPKL